MTKKKSTRPAAAEQARRNAWAAGANAFAVDTDAPCKTAPPMPQKAQPLRICNASTPRGERYYTGYGEVHQPVRAGAMAAYGVKSAGLAT